MWSPIQGRDIKIKAETNIILGTKDKEASLTCVTAWNIEIISPIIILTIKEGNPKIRIIFTVFSEIAIKSIPNL